jgi:hypothetical protein
MFRREQAEDEQFVGVIDASLQSCGRASAGRATVFLGRESVIDHGL